MPKTGLLTLLMACLSLPAYAWQLQTRVATGGGKVSYSVDVVDLDPSTRQPKFIFDATDPDPANWTATAVTRTISPVYTAANRNVALTLPDRKPDSMKKGQNVYRVLDPYPVPERVTVTVTPDPGFKLSQVYLDGVGQPLPSEPSSPSTYDLAKSGTKALKVSFARVTNTVTAKAIGKGAVSPSGSKAFDVGAPKSYVFSPQKGQRVLAIGGLAALAARPGVNLAVLDQATKTPIARDGDRLATEVNKKVVLTFSVPTGAAVELVGTFGLLDLTTNGPMTVRRPATATLTVRLRADAARVPLGVTPSFRWTQTAGPGPNLIPDPKPGQSLDLSVTPATATGTYRFKVVATAGTGTVTAETYVVVTDDLLGASRKQCESCHKAQDIGTELFAEWSLSGHATGAGPAVMCYTCHVGADSGEHPGRTVTNATCSGCHAVDGPSPAAHGTDCLACHDPHSLATELVGSLAGACFACHGTNGNTPGAKWTGSKHDTTGSEVGCAVCHTGTLHPPSTPAQEVCVGCHGTRHGQNDALTPCLTCHDAHSLRAASGRDCGLCHGTAATRWTGSRHEAAPQQVGCAACHPETGGHPSAKPTDQVCAGCHGAQHGAEPTFAPCLVCHDAHSSKATVAGRCAICHETTGEAPVARWTGSKHDAASEEVGCATCHPGTEHPEGRPTEGLCVNCHGTVHGAQATLTRCLTCHDSHSLRTKGGGDCSLCHAPLTSKWSGAKHALPYVNVACAVCHPGTEHPGRKATQALCLACHGTKHGPQTALTACLTCHDPHSLKASTGGECVLCHGAATSAWTGTKHDGAAQEVGCPRCHPGPEHPNAKPTQLLCLECHGTKHGTEANLTACLVCHDEHTLRATVTGDCGACHGEIRTGWAGTKHETATPEVGCARCHSGSGHPDERPTQILCIGCHGTKHGGRPELTPCLSCHDAHRLRAEVTDACDLCHGAEAAGWTGTKHDMADEEIGCARCHPGPEHPKEKPTQVLCLACHGTKHGTAPEVTACLVCHDGHSLRAAHVAGAACGTCHGSEAINWADTKHDLASEEVGCASCHGGPGHPEARPTDLLCAQCHGMEHGAQAELTACLTCHEAHSSRAATIAEAACGGCHGAESSGWAGTRHDLAAEEVGCTGCHGPAGHPEGRPDDALCRGCHVPAPHGTHAELLACLTCHDAHSLRATGLAGTACSTCHGTEETGWNGTKHDLASDEVGCARCHGSEGHPQSMPSEALCVSCHGQQHGSQAALTLCLDCHDAHSVAPPPMPAPHMGGTPLLQAQYVSKASLRVSCSACHAAGDTAVSAGILRAFKLSGHADITSEAWIQEWRTEERGPCQRCHTGAAFVAKLGRESGASNAFAAEDVGRPGEVLNCSACHSDLATGALRAPGAFTLTAGNGAGIAYPDVGASNLCVRCHGGRESGGSIKNAPDADGTLELIDAHHLPAAGTLFAAAGYEYDGQSYEGLGFHQYVGTGDIFDTGDRGPCVSCHMGGGSSGHSWQVVRRDGNGAITAVSSAACAKCHGGLTGAVLEDAKQRFGAALEALKAALEGKGIYAGADGGIGGFTRWGEIYGGAKWKDVMGAAFNYNLLARDPGAYAHNRQYALKLIADSCDFLADGAVDGAGIPPAVTAALQSSHFARETSHPEGIVGTGNSVTCSACHEAAPHYGGAPVDQAQYVSGASLPVSCANCHPGGTDTVANAPLLAEFAASNHGNPRSEAWTGDDWRAGSRAPCARCHNGTAYVAKLGSETDTSPIFAPADAGKPGEVLNCSACHLDVTSGAIRTPGAYTATYSWGQSFAFPDLGASNLCVRCHSALESGGSIKADPDPTGARTLIDPHSAATSQILWNRGGYQFGTLSYRPLGLVHYILGLEDSPYAGPCVTCHMGSPEQRPDHTWEAVEEDAEGRMTAIKSDICEGCHHDDAFILTITPELLAARKQGFQAALSCLEQKLAARGIYYYPKAPYFFSAPYVPGGSNTGFTNWGGVYGNANSAYEAGILNWKNVMGVAFNLTLLRNDPGAYVHNQGYARRLIYDSINFIDNGVLDATLDLTGYPEAADYLKPNHASIAAVARP